MKIFLTLVLFNIFVFSCTNKVQEKKYNDNDQFQLKTSDVNGKINKQNEIKININKITNFFQKIIDLSQLMSNSQNSQPASQFQSAIIEINNNLNERLNYFNLDKNEFFGEIHFQNELFQCKSVKYQIKIKSITRDKIELDYYINLCNQDKYEEFLKVDYDQSENDTLNVKFSFDFFKNFILDLKIDSVKFGQCRYLMSLNEGACENLPLYEDKDFNATASFSFIQKITQMTLNLNNKNSRSNQKIQFIFSDVTNKIEVTGKENED